MLDELGGTKTDNHNPNGAAMAFNTPSTCRRRASPLAALPTHTSFLAVVLDRRLAKPVSHGRTWHFNALYFGSRSLLLP